MLDDYMMFASVLPSKENQFFPSPAFYSDLGESTHHRSQCCNTLDMCNPEDKPVLSIENDFKDPSNKELFSKTEDPLFCESNTITRSIKLITDGDSIEDIDCAKLSYRQLPESETNEIDENEVIKSCQDDATGQNLVQRDILGEHPRFDSKDILMTLGPETNEVVDNEVIKSCQEDKITEDFSERDTSSNFGSEDITNFSTIEEEEEKKIDIMSSRVQTILIYSGIEGLVETQPPVVVQNEELKDRDDQEKEVQMVDVLVRMSRAMYGQLIQQVFQAPRRYPMPLPSDSHYAEVELGMKLTCGFEMMYWERAPSASEVHNPKDIGWKSFLSSLQKTGYFRGLLEGSKEYRELLENAKESYRKSSLFAQVR